ncbi:MAG TPA: ABC transporter permease [Thermoanaerobaculia bacterium]
MTNNLLLDLRHSFRVLMKRPGLTLLAVLAVALGIGAVAAIFSIINTVLLRPLPYKDPERLVRLWESNPERALAQNQVSPPLVADWQDQTSLFEDVAAFWLPKVNFQAENGEPRRVQVTDATPNLFSLLGVQPVLGQVFPPESKGAEADVILSHGFWQRQFGGDPGILGKTVSLDGKSYAVLGVMPPGMTFPEGTEIWRPITFPLRRMGRTARFLDVVARLKPGVTPEQAHAQLETFARGLEQTNPDSNKGWHASLLSLREHLIGGIRPALLLLFIAVGLVLVLACVNVANLLLAQAAARRGEIALRTALGSSRVRVVRQFLAEGVAIAVAGGVLGLILSFWGLRVLLAFVPADIPRLDEVGIDGRVVLFVLAVVGLSGIGMGLVPALRFSSRPDLGSIMKSGTPGGRTAGHLHELLVVLEVAVAMIVLVSAGLLVASLQRLTQIRPGFSTDKVLTFNLQLPMSKYAGPAAIAAYSSLLDRLRTVPGVTSVAAAAFLPLDTTAWNLELSIKGRPMASPNERISAQYHSVTPGFFETLDIPLVAGRTFTQQDSAKAPGAVIVNETMVKQYWPDGRALHQVIVPSAKSFGVLGRILPDSFEVVGIVGDVKNNGLEADPQPAMYFPLQQFPYQSLNVIVRGQGDPARLAGPVREQVRQLDPGLALSNVATMQDLFHAALARQRFSALLLSLFAGAALLLTAVGIYGVIAYGVSQRTHEIGVRMALGGQIGDIVRLILWRGVRLALIGLAIGGLGALIATRFMASLLYQIAPSDPLTFLLIATILVAVAMLASFVPARRAARVDPLKALRYQ